MTTDNNQLTDEARIRELIEERVGAIRAKDVDALMRGHAPDVVMFDALDPLRYVGSSAPGFDSSTTSPARRSCSATRL
jgi:ketosteroid isomerase-like protein